MPSVSMSRLPDALIGVEETLCPGTGSSPLPIFSRRFSSCSTRFSACSRPFLSLSVSAFNIASLLSAFSPTVAHSCSIFSTISLACFSRSSIMLTRRCRPLASLEYRASCSANCPVRACTFDSAWVSWWAWAVWADCRALKEVSVAAWVWVSESKEDCSVTYSVCFVRRYLANSSVFSVKSWFTRSASVCESCSCCVRESTLNYNIYFEFHDKPSTKRHTHLGWCFYWSEFSNLGLQGLMFLSSLLEVCAKGLNFLYWWSAVM